MALSFSRVYALILVNISGFFLKALQKAIISSPVTFLLPVMIALNFAAFIFNSGFMRFISSQVHFCVLPSSAIVCLIISLMIIGTAPFIQVFLKSSS